MTGLATSIDGLADLAVREAALAAAVAGLCGQWIAEEHPTFLRSLWADMAQSHSWYCQMWSDRFPMIPHRDLEAELAQPGQQIAELVSATSDLLHAAPDDQSRLRLVTTVVIPATLGRLEALNSDLNRVLDAPTAVIIDRIQADLHRLLYAASQV
jgi:hypothetical protein